MPRATIDLEETEEFQLKTCPGGFVKLRRMSYGQTLDRRALMKLSISTTKGSKTLEGEMAMANQKIQIFEFRHCIVDHNLEDEDGQKLNLGDPVVLAKLDPRIGAEVESKISDMNNFEDDEDDEQGN